MDDVMRESMRRVVLAAALLVVAAVASAEKADLVVVKKSESRLYLERAGRQLASFKVAFGGEPKGHKQQEGDERTPEGRYLLDSRNANSTFYKAIRISYPNANDGAAAKARGVSPGGLIMIHGQRNGLGWLAPIAQLFDWTDGCIALKNSDMDEVWNAVEVGTPIEIYP
jgi:murein L,D-transpeptidase YafK